MTHETTNLLKEAIFQLLTRKGVIPSQSNIKLILRLHLESDEPLIDLIDEQFPQFNYRTSNGDYDTKPFESVCEIHAGKYYFYSFFYKLFINIVKPSADGKQLKTFNSR